LNPYCGVISKFFESIIKGESPKIHGDGEQTRDFTYIDDVVDATVIAAISPKTEGEVYNVGSGIETSVNDLMRKVLKISSTNLIPKYVYSRDIDNVRRRVLNIEKMRKTLHYVPSTPLEYGLRKTYDWLMETYINNLSRDVKPTG
jgi:UDP-glucose 4-epimerase